MFGCGQIFFGSVMRSTLIPHLVEGGASILYYVVDTILFLENNLKKTIIMKLILYIFEQLSILKIIFYKSKLIFLDAKRQRKTIQTFFSCESGFLPLGYLGYLSIAEIAQSKWPPAEKCFEGKLGCWKGKVTLIQRSSCPNIFCSFKPTNVYVIFP